MKFHKSIAHDTIHYNYCNVLCIVRVPNDFNAMAKGDEIRQVHFPCNSRSKQGCGDKSPTAYLGILQIWDREITISGHV